MSNSTAIPEGYKRCSSGDACVHPDGPILPATNEYFGIWQKRGKVQMWHICRKCSNTRSRLWREKHPERARESVNRWAKANLDKKRQSGRESQRKRRINNPDKMRAINRKHREAHREQARKNTQKYRKENPDKVQEGMRRWARENAPKRRRLEQSRESQKRSLPATFTVADWEHALNYFHGCCAVCGRPPGFWHRLAQDHWIPLSKGGGYTRANIIPLCHGNGGCNNSKRNHDANEWLTEQFGKRKANQVLKRIQEYFDSLKESNH